jgi:hypothetical protein
MSDPTNRGPLTRLVAERPRLMATPTLIARMRAVLKEHRTKEWSGKVAEQADHLLTLPPLSSTKVHDPI